MNEVTTLILGSAFTLVGALAGILVQFFLSERAQRSRRQEERSQELAKFDDQLIQDELELVRMLLSDILDHFTMMDSYITRKVHPKSSKESIQDLERQIDDFFIRIEQVFKHAAARISSLPYQKLHTNMNLLMATYNALGQAINSGDTSNFPVLKNNLTLAIARMYADMRQYRRLVMRGDESVVLDDWDEVAEFAELTN